MHDIFVAAIDAVDIAEHRAACGREHCDENDRRRSKRRRTDDLSGFQLRRALYRDAVWIMQYRRRAEAVELGVINSALLIHPIMNQGCSFGLCCDHCKEGKIIDVQTRVWACMNFLGESDQLGRLKRYINEFCDSVF